MFELLQFRETKSRNGKPKFALNSETSTFKLHLSSFYSNVFTSRSELKSEDTFLLNRNSVKELLKNSFRDRFENRSLLFTTICSNLAFYRSLSRFECSE